MANITVQEVQAWLESTKLSLGTLDTDLETHVASQVLGRVAQAYDVSGWLSSATTPKLVRSVISMYYAAWYYDRTYSDDADESNYAARLRQRADLILDGIAMGTVDLADAPTPSEAGQPVFYPNDISSDPELATASSDPSAGPPAFTMGDIW